MRYNCISTVFLLIVALYIIVMKKGDSQLRTKIFLDSGDIDETKEALQLLGFLDGQTTNPSLIAKKAGERRMTEDKVYAFYREQIRKLREILPQGSISVEVYADSQTTADDMYLQAKEMNAWADSLHIKLPSTNAGLKAGEKLAAEGVNLNFTLCFSQAQAAAVHAATRNAAGSIFVSPFIGRLDDRGDNGVDVVKNILRMYRDATSHVQVLAASIRSEDHLFAVLKEHCDIATVPFRVLKPWAARGAPLPGNDFTYDAAALQPISYQKLDMEQHWQSFDLQHALTTQGIEKFARDWNSLIE